jgi:hypothetical protein
MEEETWGDLWRGYNAVEVRTGQQMSQLLDNCIITENESDVPLNV